MRLLRPRGVTAEGADALITLVRGRYPSATVLFPGALQRSSPDVFEALSGNLQARRAAQHGLTTDPTGAGRLLARHEVPCPPPAAAGTPSSWWWHLYEAESGAAASEAGTAHAASKPHACRPDAVVLIDGVEAKDVMDVVAPALLEEIPSASAPCSTVGDAKAAMRGARRREPRYTRQCVDWARVWDEKRCMLRGADLVELSLPVPGCSDHTGADARERMLVSVANPGITMTDLHRQKRADRRGPLRTAFGYSLPCLQAALPAAVVTAVRALRQWQQDALGSPPCTSAFWVSGLGHLLDADADSPLQACAEWCVREAAEAELSVDQAAYVAALLEPSSPARRGALCCPHEQQEALLAYVLCLAAVQQLRARDALQAWNHTNFFLPGEHFGGTSDTEALERLLHTVVVEKPTFPGFCRLCDAAQH